MRVPGRTMLHVAVAQGAAGSLDLVAAVTGLRVKVVRIVLVADAAGTLKFQEGTGPTDLSGPVALAANGGFVVVGDGDTPVLETQVQGNKLSIVSTILKASGWIDYFLEA